MEQNITSLQSLLEVDLVSWKQVRVSFAMRGWLCVELPPDVQNMIKSILPEIEALLQKEDFEKEEYEGPSAFGYSNAGHKESIRWKTSNRFVNPIPDLCPGLDFLTTTMDKLALNLAKILTTQLFESDPEVFGQTWSIPLLTYDRPFGLLDIAHYFNAQDKFETSAHPDLPPEMNCSAHHDPGLISLSFVSKGSGLELLDENENWIGFETQGNIAVLWCGEAARKASSDIFKPAVHRVRRNVGHPRLAIWYEICTADQDVKKKGNYERRTGIPRTKKGKGGKSRRKNLVRGRSS